MEACLRVWRTFLRVSSARLPIRIDKSPVGQKPVGDYPHAREPAESDILHVRLAPRRRYCR